MTCDLWKWEKHIKKGHQNRQSLLKLLVTANHELTVPLRMHLHYNILILKWLFKNNLRPEEDFDHSRKVGMCMLV